MVEVEPAAAPIRSGPRFYYGWVNVAVAAVAMSATLPGRTYGLGLVKEPLRADLGMGDLRFNALNFWAIALGAVLVVPASWLIDRLGARRVLAGVAVLLGVSVLLMARAADEPQLFVTLTLVRGLGQGALSVVAIALVGKWFRRRAGVAMGLFTVLLAFGFVAPFMVLPGVVAESGWRAAWAGIGYALILGLAPLGLLLARSTPEGHGVPPDDPAPESAAPPATLTEAARTPAFWVYTATAAVFNLTLSALTLDNESLLTERGLDGATLQGQVVGVIFLSGLPANLAAGLLSRFVPLGRLLAAGAVTLAASLALFPFVTSVPAALLYAALLGAGGGVITVVYFAVYGHNYGRAHLGSIQGAVQVLLVAASAVGPVLLALVREWTPSSNPFFAVSAVVTLALAVAAWAVRPPAAVRP